MRRTIARPARTSDGFKLDGPRRVPAALYPPRLAAPPDSAQPLGMERKLMPDWMVTPAYGPDLTFGRIAINEGALCIECKARNSLDEWTERYRELASR